MMSDCFAVPNNVDVTVVGGAGHVGLPLALTFADEGFKTLIFDLNSAALDKIAAGVFPHFEHDGEALLERTLEGKNLFLTDSVDGLNGTGTVVITIGTPVDEFHNPVHKAIKECVDLLLPHMTDGQLIILRSTVYPGTTDWLSRYLAALGRSIEVAFCPERVVQGHSLKELREIPQIISGTSPEAVEEAKLFFNKISKHIVTMEPKEAEFAKLFCNASRYIQFAATNEFYMIADAAGLDYNLIYEGMTRHYPRAQPLAKPGFAAGPCLFKDTAQLVAFAKNNFSLGNASILVNEGLVLHVIEKMREEYDLENLTVGLLGMAFKAGIDDIRSSLSYKMKKILSLHAAKVLTTDPYVTIDPELVPVDSMISDSDILVLCTPHDEYRDLDLQNKPVIDVWGYF
jgi:UDP-N-acetyl-D-mannosaminuronic acid dehydrogenase